MIGVSINANGTMTLTGTNLAAVTKATLGGGVFAAPIGLTLGAATATQIIVAAAVSLASGTYSVVVSTASADSAPLTVTFTFTPTDGSVTARSLGPDLRAGFLAWGDFDVSAPPVGADAFVDTGSSSQTIAAGAGDTTIWFNSVADTDATTNYGTLPCGGFNDNNAYDTSKPGYVALAQGVYHFDAQVRCSGTPDGDGSATLDLQVERGGVAYSAYELVRRSFVAADDISLNGGVTISMQPADVAYVTLSTATHALDCTLEYHGSQRSTVSGYRVY